jgi:hypothetical protein
MHKRQHPIIEILMSIAIVIYLIMSLSILFSILVLKWLGDKLIEIVTIKPKEKTGTKSVNFSMD